VCVTEGIAVKILLSLLLVVCVAFGLLLCTGDNAPQDDRPVTGLPWQIERLPDGATRVFDIVLGRTTLGAAIERLGEAELAIIAAPGEAGTLEAFYRHYAAGPITGSLILVADVDSAALAAMRARAQQAAGTRRYLLDPDDLPAARAARVKIITFLPTLNLDAGIARARFGAPGEVITAGDGQQHWLYPEQGLDFLLNARGRDLLQYLAADAFSAHRDSLRRNGAGGQ
jgi:hypothetical protein